MSLTKYLSYISFPNPESIQAMHPITIFPQNIYIFNSSAWPENSVNRTQHVL